RDVDVWNAAGGADVALAVIRRRRGRAYDPTVAALILSEGATWLAHLDQADPWDEVIEAEPDPHVVGGDKLDDVLVAFADFTDIKSPAMRGHSRSVAELAAAAATAAGLS